MMTNFGIDSGSIISGPMWPEVVKVISVKKINTQMRVEAVGINTQRYFSLILSGEDFKKIKIISSQETKRSYKSSPKHFRLAIEANRIRLAYE